MKSDEGFRAVLALVSQSQVWKPRTGDVLTGVVRAQGDWHDDYGHVWPALLVDQDGREVVVVVRPRVLRAKLNY